MRIKMAANARRKCRAVAETTCFNEKHTAETSGYAIQILWRTLQWEKATYITDTVQMPRVNVEQWDKRSNSPKRVWETRQKCLGMRIRKRANEQWKRGAVNIQRILWEKIRKAEKRAHAHQKWSKSLEKVWSSDINISIGRIICDLWENCRKHWKICACALSAFIGVFLIVVSAYWSVAPHFLRAFAPLLMRMRTFFSFFINIPFFSLLSARTVCMRRFFCISFTKTHCLCACWITQSEGQADIHPQRFSCEELAYPPSSFEKYWVRFRP